LVMLPKAEYEALLRAANEAAEDAADAAAYDKAMAALAPDEATLGQGEKRVK
jgi:hypothetical protein